MHGRMAFSFFLLEYLFPATRSIVHIKCKVEFYNMTELPHWILVKSRGKRNPGKKKGGRKGSMMQWNVDCGEILRAAQYLRGVVSLQSCTATKSQHTYLSKCTFGSNQEPIGKAQNIADNLVTLYNKEMKFVIASIDAAVNQEQSFAFHRMIP
ncbi:hypothetical protein BDV25DRAFT_166014 [Aspergillus avenaceus]|uniref:Uncharacterized protein n=1 Tax=Aspergillus avenaceus TaxID=36643 RepID=A0A5N6TEU0_ASPAV|nr:hypothetical protein BDV25DRAFT_166014 [Aspergillus avenaceus]